MKMTNTTENTAQDTAQFGFEEIPRSEKTARVRGVFEAVASRYDIMNDVMSLGMHRMWKQNMIRALRPKPGMRLLDLAGGTGDIAFRVLQATEKFSPPAEVTLCDINTAMLGEGRDRAINKNQLANIEWVCGNAESLPFSDMAFDACTIAFGMRNVTDIPAALREIRRVLKPGGQFLCLEFSKVNNATLSHLYDAYSFHLIPRIGEKIVGDGKPYQYLVESIRNFPGQQAYADMLKDAGLSGVRFDNMTGGVVALHSGYRT